MFDPVRRLSRKPTLAVPGRPACWRLFAPELCALAVYLAMPFLLSPGWTIQLIGNGYFWPPWWLWDRPDYAIRALKVTGPLMVLLAIWLFAPAVARERELGTLETFVLVPDHNRALVSRFLRGLWPLFRFAACLAPIYAITARTNGFAWLFRFGASGWSIQQLEWLCYFFAPLRSSDAAGMWYTGGDWDIGCGDWSSSGFFFAGMRWINDGTAMLLAAAVAWYLSICSRSSIRATARAAVVSGLLLLTVLSPDLWWLLLHCVLPRMGSGQPLLSNWQYHPTPQIVTYWATVACTAVARVGLALLLVRHSRHCIIRPDRLTW
jgi:hypothetical protein